MSVVTSQRPRNDASLESDPLTSTHRLALADARERAKPIRKAARVAAFNGWTTAAVAALSAPFAFFSMSGLALTVVIAIVAYNEFRGRKRLLKFDPTAATLLGWNQLGLLAMIVVYCLWMTYAGLTVANRTPAEAQAYAELDAALGSPGAMNSLYRTVVLSLYGSVLVLSVLFQGANALYYFTRRKRIEAFVAATPAWICDLERGTSPA